MGLGGNFWNVKLNDNDSNTLSTMFWMWSFRHLSAPDGEGPEPP